MIDQLFAPDALWFSVPAVVGSVVFLFRLAMMLLGGDGGGDFEGDFDAGGVDGVGDGVSVLSVQSIAAFLMGFGWAALLLYRGLGLHWAVGALGGLGFGVALTALQVWLLTMAYGMQSSGNIDISSATGLEGEVYVSIPESGRGEVRLTISGNQKIYTAESVGGVAIARGTRVKIVNARPGTVTVEAIEA